MYEMSFVNSEGFAFALLNGGRMSGAPSLFLVNQVRSSLYSCVWPSSLPTYLPIL